MCPTYGLGFNELWKQWQKQRNKSQRVAIRVYISGKTASMAMVILYISKGIYNRLNQDS